MKHPITGDELDPAWMPIDTVPKPEGKAEPFNCLVLMEGRAHVHKTHIGLASIHKNVSCINGTFAFDMPKVLAWRHLPAIFKE